MINGVWNKENVKHYKLITLKNEQRETNRKLDIIANHLSSIEERISSIEERISAIEAYLSDEDV